MTSYIDAETLSLQKVQELVLDPTPGERGRTDLSRVLQTDLPGKKYFGVMAVRRGYLVTLS